MITGKHSVYSISSTCNDRKVVRHIRLYFDSVCTLGKQMNMRGRIVKAVVKRDLHLPCLLVKHMHVKIGTTSSPSVEQPTSVPVHHTDQHTAHTALKEKYVQRTWAAMFLLPCSSELKDSSRSPSICLHIQNSISISIRAVHISQSESALRTLARRAPFPACCIGRLRHSTPTPKRPGRTKHQCRQARPSSPNREHSSPAELVWQAAARVCPGPPL